MSFKIGRDAQIHPTARMHVLEGFIGDRAIIGEHAVIEGNRVEIGHEPFIDAYAWIGGGSCFDSDAYCVIGDFLHMGRYSHINSLWVEIGHEFGCGLGTNIFAHGAYLPIWDGFPVQWGPVKIGDRVWMPHAWVNPGVTIGSNVVVAAMSLINRDLPSGCLAGGIPVKILRENAYPNIDTTQRERAIKEIMKRATQADWRFIPDTGILSVGGATFSINERRIDGLVSPIAESVKNQLRRNGIRFRYTARDGVYVPWAKY